VLILTGAPGSGKSTVAGLLACKWPRAVHIECDQFFHFIKAGYIEPWKPESHEQNTTVMRIVGQAAAAYAAGGYFTIIDGIVLPSWFLSPLTDALGAAGHAVAYAVLRAPLAVCHARVKDRAHGGRGDAAVVERLWREFAGLGPLERHAIDNGTQDPGATADLLAAQLTSLLVAAQQ